MADGSWQKDTVNSITDRYWVRLSANGTMTGTGTIWRVSIAPYRPPIDKDLFPQTGPALAGALPHILVGSWRGETLVWHQVWTLQSPQIEQLLIGRTTGRNSFGRQTLWAITDTGFFHMPIGPSAHPSRMSWPLTNSASVPHTLVFSGHHFGLPVNVKSVQTIVLHGEFLQADDEFWVYHRWDNDDRWHKNGPQSHFPVVLNDLEGRGRVLHVAVQLKDATRDAVAPYITHAIIPKGKWFDEGAIYEALGQDISSPQET